MKTEAEFYFASLDKFFKGLRKSYDREKVKYEKTLSRFFESLMLSYRVEREIKKHTDKFLASDFNLLGIMTPDENRISDVVAELLRPNGKHGQGKIFLQKFLDVLVSEKFIESEWLPKNLAFSCITVGREHSTNKNRRIDIFLKFRGGFTIGIENKPWAGEQENQLRDYAEYLKGISKEGKFLLIYLDGWGRKATTIEQNGVPENGKFIELSYHKFLIPWLKECLRDCEAEKVRWFLRDFITWIEKTFREGVNDG